MSETEHTTSDRERRERDDRRSEEAVEAIASSTIRIGLAILGILLLLYAVGQAVGVDALGMVSSALDTPEARWLVVAFFALVLIAVALRGFRVP